MADSDKKQTPNDANDSDEKSLEEFITHHYQRQKENGKMDATEDIDDDRTSNFFDRAISESRRMNKEVDKSQVKLDKLSAEFGAERITAWQAEHAAEVLTPQQIAVMGIQPTDTS
ncbi:uncharacterized protein LOC110449379 [Mizuhopecten yessoensis]|uniref:Uncharacterized protein n=1 Tax=Mizuhopecten yessoensis TaxID=6573 RepID=A0A210QRA8_MIZYE|nr:uncharacterized protein LOC110449379 [Mizuhopecten yessoensis]OWF51287.1 hypothetical protein KP79_PYT24261 [Mizuhopecten yessoensis]